LTQLRCDLQRLAERDSRRFGFDAEEAAADALVWFYQHPATNRTFASVYRQFQRRLIGQRLLTRASHQEDHDGPQTASIYQRF
jgi:hypothetical protein